MTEAARIITPAVSREAETVAAAYLADARGDAVLALQRAVVDALADLCEAERRSQARERLISRGFVRQGIGRDCQQA